MIKNITRHVFSKIHRTYVSWSTSLTIAFGRWRGWDDKKLAEKILGNMSAEDSRQMLVLVRINDIAEGMRKCIGLTKECDLFDTFFGMAVSGKYLPPEISNPINALFSKTATVSDAVELWIKLNQYNSNPIRLTPKFDPMFFESFGNLPINAITGFATNQEDYDNL